MASAGLNGIIAVAYLCITWTILRGLVKTNQVRSNPLALATAAIFFTCAVHHGLHPLHMLGPAVGVEVEEGLAMREAFSGKHMSAWDFVGAIVAVYYLSLRRSYDRLLTSPAMFEDAVRRRAEERLLAQAFTDALTGLPNRAAFNARMADLVVPEAGTVGLLFLDVDRFKVVNDTLGHAAGDELLHRLGRRLQAALHEGEELYRLGGDEFTVLCPIGASRAHALDLSARLRAALVASEQIGGHAIVPSASIGVATGIGPDAAKDLLRQADVAMYQAKAHAGTSTSVFDPTMSDDGLQLDLWSALGLAVERDELRLDLHPLVELPTGRMVAGEALVRWQHPTRGLLGPKEFLPVAEQTGQIVPIGRWVLRQACAQAADWPAGPDVPLSICVSVSTAELAEPDLPAAVADALARSGLAPDRLWIEVAEQVVGAGVPSPLQARLSELASLGVGIVLDHFGAGSASLVHAHGLPIRMVKIDRSFVAADADVAADAVVASIVALGRALDLVVLAEGIEAAVDVGRMRALGCDVDQGEVRAR